MSFSNISWIIKMINQIIEKKNHQSNHYSLILNHNTSHWKDIVRWAFSKAALNSAHTPQGSLCVCLYKALHWDQIALCCAFSLLEMRAIFGSVSLESTCLCPFFVLNAEWWHLQKITPSEETVSVALLSFCWWQNHHRKSELVLLCFKQPLFPGEMFC